MAGFRIPRHPEAFSLDRDRKARGGRRQEQNHLAFIRQLPCCVCGKRTGVEAAHLRLASPVHGKGVTGMATKPSDCWVTPLCAEHHRTDVDSQHAGSEVEFWDRHGIDPFMLALSLHAASGDIEAGELIIQAARVRAKAKASA